MARFVMLSTCVLNMDNVTHISYATFDTSVTVYFNTIEENGYSPDDHPLITQASREIRGEDAAKLMKWLDEQIAKQD